MLSAYRISTLLKKKRVNPLAIVVVLLSGVWSTVRFNDIPVGAFFDDAHYLVLAESLANGRGYHLINYPHAPVETAFPPGWPLLLVPVTAVFGSSLFWPRLVAFFFWLAAIPLAYKLFAHRLPPALAPFFVILLGVNPHLVGMAGTAMSEPAFLFFSLLTLVLGQAWLNKPERRTFWLLLAIGAAAFATMLTRTIGLALGIAMLVSLLRTARRDQLRWLLLAGGVGVLSVGLWATFNQQTGGRLIFSQTYWGHLAYLLPRWAEFLQFWAVDTAVSPETLANAVVPVFELQAITNLLGPSLMQAAAVAVLALVGWGFILNWRHRSPVEWYVLGYLLIFYVWAVYIDTIQPRIALPLIPFATLYLVTAVASLLGWLGQLARRVPDRRLVQAVLTLLILTYLGRNLYASLNPVSQEIVNLAAGTTWIAQNVPADAVVMSPNPVSDYLYMRRLAVDYPTEPSRLAAQLENYQVDFILVRPNLAQGRQPLLDPRGAQILNMIQSDPEQFRLIHRNQTEQVWVYQLEK